MARRNSSYDYDLIVIGSGAGGGVGANLAASMGKKVAIFEEEAVVGGECPNWACVPTKALLHAAERYEQVQSANNYGIKATAVGFDYKKVKEWKDLVVKRTGTAEGDKAFFDAGIEVHHEHAHFINPHEISAGGKRYRAKKFLLATGTHNFIPPIEGLEETGYITFREAIDLTKVPKTLFVIGGGAIGCEFAQLFNSFGVEVTMVELAPRLLGREEPEAAELVKAVFKNRGINVITGGAIHSLKSKAGRKVIKYTDGKQEHEITVDEVLVASGKRANTDIGLDNAGVKFSKFGITTNHFMQTSAKHIYAAGDCVGPYQFTHTASYQSRLAAHNMYSRKQNKIAVDYRAIPRTVFVSPEVASVGMTESELRNLGVKVKVGISPISVIGRSNTEDKQTGFVKIIANQKKKILGAAIVAPRAGEMIHELGLAIKLNATTTQVAEMIHAFPTWNEAIRIAAHKIR